MDKSWSTKEKLVGTLIKGGFEEQNIDVHRKEDQWHFASEQERWEYFCHPFWGLWKVGWTDEEAGKWDSVIREELVKFHGEGSVVKGVAWIAVAKK
jgi:hypothetical protein